MNLQQRIVLEIEKNGPISFARFMELALYAPDQGYYERRARVGREGDFYTSVSVGPVFGELLAEQFTEWSNEFTSGTPLDLVECGANDGQLALDILMALNQHSPDLLKRIRYKVIESSPIRAEWQREMLQGFSNVSWVSDIQALEPISGFIFSNELLDAIPFHRIRWNKCAGCWHELLVHWSGELGFHEILAASEARLSHLPQIPGELAEVLPDGFTTEVSPAATNWWMLAGSKLKQGKLIAIDYGFSGEEFLMPERSRGTARSYLKHRLVEDLLANVGEQDITAHVSFSAVAQSGENVGLETEFFGTQAAFISRLLGGVAERASTWDRKKLSQLQTLTHPAHLGTKFKVLVQGRTKTG